MTSISDVIRKRYSCRAYSETPVDSDAWRAFRQIMDAGASGPFGHTPRFVPISMEKMTRDDWKKLGTYGVIKNARLFLAGVMKPGPMAACDYGYCKENLILNATRLGINTCWLGGTFSVGAFGRAAGLRHGEVLPTVSPLGYAADRQSMIERLMRRFAGSDHRLPWPDLFFKGNAPTPLSPVEAGPHREALENVRLAPSASNKQPWRIICDERQKTFAFYLSRSAGYKHLWHISLQDIDMGIAICHFDLTVAELGFKGIWHREDPAPQIKSLEYVASWQADG